MEAGPKQQQQQQQQSPQQPQQQQQQQSQQPVQQQQQQQQNSPGSAGQPQGQAAVGPQGGAPTPGGQGQQNAEDALAATENTPVDEGVLLARIHVPELYVSKCLQFPKDQLVWDVKQQCLASLPKVRAAPSERVSLHLCIPNVPGRESVALENEPVGAGGVCVYQCS